MIKLIECSKVYANGSLGVENVNLELPATGIIGVLGKSGSGKSTLINCLGGLDSFSSGSIFVNGKEVDNLFDYSSYIFQEFKLFEELDVMENITFSLKINEEMIDELLDSLGILSIKRAKVKQISGGQRQRVAIARALVRNDAVLFCDEPTASLDDGTGTAIMEIFKRVSQDRLVMIVSHDETLLKKYTEHLIYVKEGIVTSTLKPVVDQRVLHKAAATQKLFYKDALQLSLNNLKHNKIKAILTTFFLWLSMSIIFLLMSISTINISQISYQSFKKNQMPYVEFIKQTSDGEFSVPKNLIHQMDEDIISYQNVNFHFKFENQTYYANHIWVVTNNQFGDITLDNDQIIVSTDLLTLNDEVSNTILLPNKTLTIKSVLELHNENMVIVNQQTFNQIKANLFEQSMITYQLTTGEAYTTTPIYNPYYVDNKIKITAGAMPKQANEAAVPVQLLNDLYPQTLATDLIGRTIEISFLPNKTNRFSGSEKDQVIKEQIIVTGITDDGFIFSPNALFDITSNYGSERIDNGLSSLIIYEYTLKTFQNGQINQLTHISALSDDVYFVYNMLNGIKNYLIVIVIIFLVLAIITIMNSVTTSLLKSKKELGVLIAFKIQKQSLSKIFLFENILLFLLSVILSTIIYIILLNYLNVTINREFKMNISILNFKYLLVLFSVLTYTIILDITVRLPLRKLTKKTPIDILFER